MEVSGSDCLLGGDVIYVIYVTDVMHVTDVMYVIHGGYSFRRMTRIPCAVRWRCT